MAQPLWTASRVIYATVSLSTGLASRARRSSSIISNTSRGSTALLEARDFEREPSSHHWAAAVAHVDNQIACKSVTVGSRQLVPQHVGKGIGRFVLHFVHRGKLRSLFVGNEFVVIAQIEIVEGHWRAPS